MNIVSLSLENQTLFIIINIIQGLANTDEIFRLKTIFFILRRFFSSYVIKFSARHKSNVNYGNLVLD